MAVERSGRPVGPVTAVDVHLVALNRDRAEADAIGVLSPRERERLASFRYRRDRRRYAVCRASLRRLLGSRLGVAAGEVVLAEGEMGKPFVPGGPPFNVSHSGELALIAVAAGGGPIGIDLEQIRRDRPVRQLARRFFSVAERRALDALGEEELSAAFYWCWTAKEAYLKALGVGLTRPLDSFDVSVGLSSPPRLLDDRGDAGAGRWTLRRLQVADGFAATLAIAAGD